MCGYAVREVAVGTDGDVDIDQLRAAVGAQTAGIMLTNPSTCGVFERRIGDIADIVHNAGGLLYYDGANLNAILGKVRPGDMGFDVLHMNLHKTFATPHGGGGPGSGPVAVAERLVPFLPVPFVQRVDGEGTALPLGGRRRTAAVHRQTLRLHGQRRHLDSGAGLRADARRPRHGARGRPRHVERQLPDDAAAASGVHARLSGAARHPRVHRHPAKGGEQPRRQRHGFRQAPLGLRLPRAHHLLSPAGAGVPAHRTNGDRNQSRTGRLRGRDGAHPRRGGPKTRNW